MTQEEYEERRRALEQELQSDLALIHAAHEARVRSLDRLRRLALEENEAGAGSALITPGRNRTGASPNAVPPAPAASRKPASLSRALWLKIESHSVCYCPLLIMDPHRLGEERSVAYHRVIGERLRNQPEILERARQRVQGWLAASAEPPFYARKWAEILAGDASSIAAFLVDRGELATELRQSSPFAGALQPEERWKIFRDIRERFSQQA